MLPKTNTGLGLGFFLGIASLALAGYKAAPDVMILEDDSALGCNETVATLKEAAAKQGCKIPKVQHELHKSMAKHGHTADPVTVFELCHIDHAAKVLKDSDRRVVTLMMPCRVPAYVEGDGKVIVSRMNSGAMARVFSRNVAQVMEAASRETGIIPASVLTPAG
jgi:uncharacterized protein (DUF302 family)